MKKIIIFSLIGITMFTAQISSISVDEYIKLNGKPEISSSISPFLDLSNKNITDLEGLQNIPNSGKVLSLILSNNALQKLPAGIFSNFPNLEKLYLDNNQRPCCINKKYRLVLK